MKILYKKIIIKNYKSNFLNEIKYPAIIIPQSQRTKSDLKGDKMTLNLYIKIIMIYFALFTSGLSYGQQNEINTNDNIDVYSILGAPQPQKK